MTLALEKIKALIIDMDGVLWQDETPLPGLAEFFQMLRDYCIPFVVATNNSTKTPQQYIEKAKLFEIAIAAEEIITSAIATAGYLQEKYPSQTKIYVMGMNGIRRAVAEAGFHVVEQDAQVVVAGLDRQLTYEKLKTACLLIAAGADFVGTNGDKNFPTPEGLIPGGGSILAAITATTGKLPHIIGKPNSTMFNQALERLHSKCGETAVIGDRLDTDIAGAVNLGIKSILVMSGVTTFADLSKSDIQPDLVCKGIDELTALWRKNRAL